MKYFAQEVERREGGGGGEREREIHCITVETGC